MGLRKTLLWSGLGALGLLAGCGGMDDGLDAATSEAGRADAEVTAAAPGTSVEAAPTLTLHDDRKVQATPPVAPPAAQFQPGYHSPLRLSTYAGSITTYRIKVPVGRAGSRVRVTFRSGDGSMTLQRATVAKAGANGALASAPVPLTFGGKAGFTANTRTLVTSDAVGFPVAFGDELAISFEAKGDIAWVYLPTMPGGYTRSGAYATTQGALGGSAWTNATGVATLDVEGPTTRTFVALGDSITEGYIDDPNDMRNAWPFLVQRQLGLPVVNSGVSGQGFWDANRLLSQEVLAMQGFTDCIVLLGTNDLGDHDTPESVLEQRMTQLLDALQPRCRLWVSTLLPRNHVNNGDTELAKVQRKQFNAWLRGLKRAEIIDLEAVTRRPDDIDEFLPGLSTDGIHPTKEGQQVVADEVVRVLKARGGL